MGLARQIKRKQVLEVVGKCRKCQHSYEDKQDLARCEECHVSKEFIHFKRRAY